MRRRRVFPQLFRVLPNFHECLYNSIETQSTLYVFFISFRKHHDEKKENNFNVNFHPYVIGITTSTVHASFVSPSSYTNTIFNQSARVLS